MEETFNISFEDHCESYTAGAHGVGYRGLGTGCEAPRACPTKVHQSLIRSLRLQFIVGYYDTCPIIYYCNP